MRVGAIRTDIQKVYLADIENRAQRCFSSEPPGQSRYLEKPSDDDFKSVLDTYAFLSLYGSNNAATVNTTGGNNVFKVRVSATAAYTTINVTSNAALAKATIRNELNAGFESASLPLVARLVGNRIIVDSNGSNSGPAAYIGVDVGGNSTLNPIVGFTAGALSGLSVTALKAAVYAGGTVDVSSATILALSTFTRLLAAAQDALVGGIADLAAPSLIETGPVLLSFVYGNLSKYNSADFQPGGDRAGLTAGAAVVCLEDDGSTLFSV